MTERSRFIIAVALATGVAASLLNLARVEHFDVGEISQGRLTGPMIASAFMGSWALLAGAILQIWWRRVGGGMSLAGFVLMLPLFSWFFAAGLWCLDGRCYGEYPLFSFDTASAVTVVLACTSIVLQWWPGRQ